MVEISMQSQAIEDNKTEPLIYQKWPRQNYVEKKKIVISPLLIMPNLIKGRA